MSEDNNAMRQAGVRVLDLLLADIRTCSPKEANPCGCPFMGILDDSGHARLFPLDRDLCSKLLDLLPPVERNFWKKRMDQGDPLQELGNGKDLP